jgi:rubrerythrin
MTTVTLEPGMPQTIGEAFAHIGTVTAPTVQDIKVMCLVEAASRELYLATAATADNPAVADLLNTNGDEEFRHARRAAAVLKVLTGTDYLPPEADANPYLAGGTFPIGELTPAGLRKLSQAEFGGEALYESWAASIGNAEAAALLRANGKEETDHGNRLLQAAALLEG